MYYDILDKKRLDILPFLKKFKNNFYLAGGTALALYLGHRDSIDFDFFSKDDIDTVKLFKKIKDVFVGHRVLKIQEEKNTLTILVDDEIKISFFTYQYELLKEKREEKNLLLASLEDIACMKLSAVLGRASNKDYIDLYYILKKYKLAQIIKLFQKKFTDTDVSLVLKSLVYFDDIDMEAINFKHNKDISFEELKKDLIQKVKLLNK